MSKNISLIILLLSILVFNSISNTYGQTIFLKRGIYNFIDKDVTELKNVKKVVKKSNQDVKKIYEFNSFGKVCDLKLFHKLRLISHFTFEYNDKGNLEKIYCLYDLNNNKHSNRQLYTEFKYKLDSDDRILTEFEVSKNDTLLITNYSYDSTNRIVEYAVIVDKIDLGPCKIKLTYDNNGNVKSQCELINAKNYCCWNYDYINKNEVNISIENSQEGNLTLDKRLCKREYDNKGNWIKCVTYVENADKFIEKRKIKYN